MDEVLYPEEALAFLQTMRYAPDARRGFEGLSGSFHWSDEGLPRAMRLCLNYESRATFYTMVFRTSLIKGEPIEEYRRNWDQLRATCPDWPGFRPERCGTDLLPAWQRTLKRMCVGFERDLRHLEPRADSDAGPTDASKGGCGR
jgi:hypothetical protein